MSDPSLFTAGNLFTTDYLFEGVRQTPEYLAIDTAGLRAALLAVAEAFPRAADPNETQTEDDLIWPVLAAVGWTQALRQQNLTVATLSAR